MGIGRDQGIWKWIFLTLIGVGQGRRNSRGISMRPMPLGRMMMVVRIRSSCFVVRSVRTPIKQAEKLVFASFPGVSDV
jgi:hypothetical protein